MIKTGTISSNNCDDNIPLIYLKKTAFNNSCSLTSSLTQRLEDMGVTIMAL